MYAIIKTGGKQYKVSEGQALKVEKLEAKEGENITISEVLMVGGDGNPAIGAPVVDGASVAAKVVKQGRARKILVYKKKRRKGYEKKTGHRQPYTELKIEKINA